MKTIGIYPNIDKDVDYLGTGRVIDTLRGRVGMLMDRTLQDALIGALGSDRLAGIRFTDGDTLCREPDAMIVLGGDGTILEAARRCQAGGVPLLGINLGRIGYMAELELDELDELSRLIDGDFKVERRMMLEAEIGNEHLFALNDAVLGSESIFRMVEIELYCDGKLVNRYRADGLIASTPTGSTAYSLSAGGAVVDPRMEAMIFTPICSHALNAASLVFSADSCMVMKNVTDRADKLLLSIDGCEQRVLGCGETVTIRRSPVTTGFIRLKDGGFYEVLRHKMA
ncbi:MAG: NAD(+)/NADH kinase [Ruminococcaceae bacterium]|nr:NAD(+)/NADH kinase [Oscillospiraceae bacterium]